MTKREEKLLKNYVLSKKQDYLTKDIINLRESTIDDLLERPTTSYTEYMTAKNIYKQLTGKRI